MTKCPFCGIELTDSLVTAIKNPGQPESCPKAPKVVAR